MENSLSLLFKNDTSNWFLYQKDEWKGPFRAFEIYSKIQGGEISWIDFLWKEGWKESKRICDEPTFQVKARPADAPEKKEVKVTKSPEVKKSTRKLTDEDEALGRKTGWFLYYDNTQFGPFHRDEVVRLLQTQKIQLTAFCWTEGLKEWIHLDKVAYFKEHSKNATTAPPAAKGEKRANPRHPLMAKILLSDEHTVITGLCRDISVGGMQVLTEKVPGDVGTAILINVSPSGPIGIEPFVAKGIIVRKLEDGRGFSFRFEKLNEKSKKSIEKYLKSVEKIR